MPSRHRTPSNSAGVFHVEHFAEYPAWYDPDPNPVQHSEVSLIRQSFFP